MRVKKFIAAFFRHISASGFSSGGLATRFLAGFAAVAVPYGLSVDIEPSRTPPTGEKYYFRSRLLPVGLREAAKRVFWSFRSSWPIHRRHLRRL